MNSTQLYRIEKHDGLLKKTYSNNIYTLEINNGYWASLYVDNVKEESFFGKGAWASAQRIASALAIDLDMGDL